MEHLIPAKIVQDGCRECLCDLLEESKSGGYALLGKVVTIPERWLDKVCAHGNSGLKFERVAVETVEEGDEEVELEPLEAFDTRMDATKNIGYLAREWPCTTPRYGSHPMHDPFDDESNPDGSGKY
jgi:hypothetical protein